MNKYDDINVFLSFEPNLKQDYEFLTNFITTFLYKNINREKIDDYYNKIPMIFDKIFGISTKSNVHSKKLKQSKCNVELLNSEKTSFEDFDSLLHIFLPASDYHQAKNIFTSVYSPPDYVPDYILAASIISRTIHSLITQKKQDYILTLNIFDDLTKQVEFQRNALDKGTIILTIFEYYIIIFLVAIAEISSNNNKVNLTKINKNFVDFIKNFSPRRAISEKSKENLYSIDTNRSLVHNFYMILFKNLLNYLMFSKFYNDHLKLRFLVSAIEFVWLSDYFMIPTSTHVSKSPLEIYNFFFRTQGNISPYSAPESLGLPNITLLECLYHLVVTLQSNGFLFVENPNTKSFQLREESLLFRIQKALFYFFKNSFLNFSQEYSNSEISLSDIARIWFAFITPWMQLNIPISSNLPQFQTNSHFKSNYYMNMKKSNTIDDVIREYVHVNMLFYTELFNDYIYAFSSLQVLSKKELSFFNQVLELFKIYEGFIINDFVNLKLLEDLSEGRLYNYSTLIEVDHHVKYIGSLKKNLYPFKDPQNQKNAKSILRNISNWIFKLERKDDKQEINDEIYNFLKTLKDSQKILGILYNIEEEVNERFEQSNQKNFFYDANNIYLKKQYDAIFQGNPWNRKLTTNENSLIFYSLKYFSYLIDYFKGIPIRYDRKGNREPPLTNLRFLANYYNLAASLILILIIYFLLRVVLAMIFRK